VTREIGDEPVTAADFQALFVDEPAPPDPASDLSRGRRLRRRRRLSAGVLALVATAGVGGTVGAVLLDDPGRVGVVAPPSAVPFPSGVTPSPTPTPTPTTAPAGDPTSAPRDTAPALRRDAHGNYLDADGHPLGGSIMNRDPDVFPFRDTTRNSWRLAARHLDPSRDHLADYDPSAFTGGGGGGDGIEVGQKLGWTVHGERGEGMVQLAVTRPGPGTKPHLGSGRDNADGFCNDAYLPKGACRPTTVAGIKVYLGKTPDGGFVMDRLQGDGEVASIIVSPVFGNNTSVGLHAMHVTPAAAAALLDDHALDVVG
jgi:hypothetical protein